MGMEKSAEQQARDILIRMGVRNAQDFSAGDVIEIANLIAEISRLRQQLAKPAVEPLLEALHDAYEQLLKVIDDINNEVVPFDGDDFHETLNKCKSAIAACDASKG